MKIFSKKKNIYIDSLKSHHPANLHFLKQLYANNNLGVSNELEPREKKIYYLHIHVIIITGVILNQIA